MQAAIAVLPSEVINQIAAGEVIERPASVVKELVDNAIDAGARTIAVETSLGGRELIKVIDDGCGMSPTDAVLAFERHATSKLRGFDDLWGLTTMGFRGEALPAIASVSRLTLTTRRTDAVAATRIVVEAGRLESVAEVGAPVGTTVEVADLLRHVPARLKFLKADTTEASHTTDVVAKVAMAYPGLHVRLRHNGRTALEVPPDRDVFARAQALLGPRTASRLVASFEEDAGIRVMCVLAAPEFAQTTARGVQLFVHRRPVRDRGLLHAICVGYGELIPRGRYPLAVVLVDPPVGSVDVNVHPQKVEVRFSDPSAVHAAVRHVVQAAIARTSWHGDEPQLPALVTGATAIAPPPLPFDRADSVAVTSTSGESRTAIAAPATAAAQRYAAQLRDARARPFSYGNAVAGDDAARSSRDAMRDGTQTDLSFAGGSARLWARDVKQRVHQSRAAEAAELLPWPAPVARDAVAKGPGIRAPASDATAHGSADDAHAIDAVEALGAELPAPGYFSSLRYLSQLDLAYLLCEGERELVVIDQHAAFERVELDRLQARLQSATTAACRLEAQRMLIPHELALPPALTALAVDHIGVLAQLGFEIEPANANGIVVRTIPSQFSDADPSSVVDRTDPHHALRAILERWAETDESQRLSCALAEIACRVAVPAGQPVTPLEANALLHSLDKTAHPPTPRQGHRLLVRYPLTEIRGRFGMR